MQWHDRAAFHFLTREEEQAAYARVLADAVTPGGISSVQHSCKMGRLNVPVCHCSYITFSLSESGFGEFPTYRRVLAGANNPCWQGTKLSVVFLEKASLAIK